MVCCKTLVLKSIEISFNQETPSQATFCLGPDWACHKLLKVSYDVNDLDTWQVALKGHKTDHRGHFSLTLPEGVCSLSLRVYVLSCQQKGQCWLVKGSFYPYKMDEMVCRTYTGTGNNYLRPQWGSAGQSLIRCLAANDSHGVPLGGSPSPRAVSNAICAQSESVLSDQQLSDMVWMWGQIIDHTIGLSPDHTGESANMLTTASDPYEAFPGRTIPFVRSDYRLDSEGQRQQINSMSCFVDGVSAYGFEESRGYALRALDGSGKLKVSSGPDGDLLPANVDNLPNANPTGLSPEEQFLAGDIRVNEVLPLIAMHTLFVREHNRLCDQILAEHPEWDGADELLYQEARRRLNALIQVITYKEFLPALLGHEALPEYQGYQPLLEVGISTEFSTAIYRFGHTMLSSNLKLVDTEGTVSYLPLRSVFFNPNWIRANGIDDLLVGATQQVMQNIDRFVVDDVRNFLFGPPTSSQMLDLVSLNLQRGRDHQLPGYNQLRQAYGLTAKNSWSEFGLDAQTVGRLVALYGTAESGGLERLDVWLGALLEPHIPGTAVGELTRTILVDQFTRIRDGDRFWYQIDPALQDSVRAELEATTLGQVLARNTGRQFPAEVFYHKV